MTLVWLPQLIARRLLVLIPLLFLISIAIFGLLELVPGGPVRALLGDKVATPETVAAIRTYYHLDQPFLVQYVEWLKGAVRLDFGRSIRTSQRVTDAVSERVGLTAFLGFYAFIITVCVGIPLGVIAGLHSSSFIDQGIVALTVIGVSAPAFASGILLLYIFSIALHWFPTFGTGQGFVDQLKHLTLPAVAMTLSALALIVKVTRAGMNEELQKDYVAFARARGLSSREVIFGYALRNALVSVTTVLGLVFVHMITGAVLVEVTFSLPGIGSLFVDSIHAVDIPMVQGLVMLVAIFIVAVHLIIDVIYALVDPRVRFGRMEE
jgi:peptide/nickel transport system permease protein